MNTLIADRQAARHFKSLADSFTNSRGLDHIFEDLNRGDDTLRNTVLHCVGNFMKSDDLVCIKFLKLKLLSNVIKHFIDTSSKENIHHIIEAFKQCKHREILLQQSEQFKEEKKRLDEMLKTKLPPDTKQLLE